MKIGRVRKLNNQGAAMVVVIVVVAFVSILTTILLYLAVMNFQMKSTDYNTKKSFYGAETPLEELRTMLTMDVCVAAQNAYTDIESEYGNMTPDMRAAAFQGAFEEAFKKSWETKTAEPSNPSITWNWLTGLTTEYTNLDANYATAYHIIEDDKWDATTNKCATIGCTCNYHIILTSADHGNGNMAITNADRLETITETASEGGRVYLKLKGIKVVYTEDSFTSIIKTNYCINIPNINWEVDACDDSWLPEDTTNNSHERNEINFSYCVTYMDWVKE